MVDVVETVSELAVLCKIGAVVCLNQVSRSAKGTQRSRNLKDPPLLPLFLLCCYSHLHVRKTQKTNNSMKSTPLGPDAKRLRVGADTLYASV